MKYFTSSLIVLAVLAQPGYGQDTVQVSAGWNLIGSVKTGAIPDALSTIPDSILTSSFFGYAPDVGYSSTDTLGKGLGYWVKVSADGVVIFSTTQAIDECKSKALIYQGKLYNTVKIGDQCWMAENLDVGTMVTGATEQTDDGTLEKYCYNDSLVNCVLYGGLYQWGEAMQYSTIPRIAGICPTGWHLPTFTELITLSSVIWDGGKGLTAIGEGSESGGAATNKTGFSALLAGKRDSYLGAFQSLHIYTYFWSSTEYDTTTVGYLGLWSAGHIALGYLNKDEGFSVRCLAD